MRQVSHNVKSSDLESLYHEVYELGSGPRGHQLLKEWLNDVKAYECDVRFQRRDDLFDFLKGVISEINSQTQLLEYRSRPHR